MALAGAFLCSLVAFGAQWPVGDLPYPDVDVRDGAGPSAEMQVRDAVVRFERARDAGHAPPPLAQISRLRIDGSRASALVSTSEGAQCVRLERIRDEWRVVEVSPGR